MNDLEHDHAERHIHWVNPPRKRHGLLTIAEAFVMIMVFVFLASGVVAFAWIVFEAVR